jgi:Carboxypeptidase regulatory-like domain
MMTTATSLWNRLAWIAVIVFMIAVCATARLNAQGYAKIVGTVTDPSGAVLPSAAVSVTLTKTGTVTTVKSGGDGTYVFPALLPDNYSLSVLATGFEKYTQTGIILLANQAATINVKLVVGSSAVTVSVIGDAPQIDTTSGTLSQVIDEARVVDLPLNGRNAANLITLVAGVVDASNEGNGTDQGKGKTFPAAAVTTTNGTSPQQSNYLLNGGNNVDEMTNVNGPFPFPDALQEFSVQTSNYNAEYGQSAGAVVNIITKSGGEKFHGDVFEFVRNGYFNAKPYFALTADNVHRHQYGATIGGPVIIPLISKGKSTQFFFGYQHTIYHQNSNANTITVPTLAEEGRVSGVNYADFGNLCKSPNTFVGGLCETPALAWVPTQQITNPFNNTIYSNNQIPNTAFDPASVNYEQVFPTYVGSEASGTIGGQVHYYKPTVVSFDEYIARVDHQFGDKDHLFGHYYQNYYQQAADFVSTNLSSYQSYFNTRYHNALLAETHSFTANILNNLILNFQREISLRGGPPGSYDITHYGVQNLWQPGTGPYLSASVSGFLGAGSSAFAGWERNNYTINDDLHWVKGKHNFAVGGHVEMSKFDVTNVYQSYGSFGFGTATNTLGSTTWQYPNAMANFQMGFMAGTNAFQQGNYELVRDRAHFPGVYAQDSWKISPTFTLNYGVRWENFVPWHNGNGAEQEFEPASYVAGVHTGQYSTLPPGLMLTGDTGIPTLGISSKDFQLMPRVGFAYDLSGTGKTVIRGGIGVFYQDRMPGFFNLNQASLVPNTISVVLTNPGMIGLAPGANVGGPFSDPYCTTTSFCSAGQYPNPFPFTLPFPSTKVFPNGMQVFEYDPSGTFKVPVTYDYNLTLEHQFSGNWSTRLAYVASGSRHQFVNLEVNPSVNTGSGLSTNARRVYTGSLGTSGTPFVGPCLTTTSPCTANYAQIVEASMSGSAKFNSLQGTVEKKMSRGLSLLVNYTWSKSIDDMPQATRVGNQEDLNPGASYVYPVYPAGAINMPAAALVADYKVLDRGRSDIDHPNVLSASYVYEPPKMTNGNFILKGIVNGWRTAGLIQHHSGDSMTIYMGTDNSLTGLNQDRAQRDWTKPAYSRQSGTGDCQPGKLCVNWFNPGAFSTPPQTGAGTGYGNIVKGTYRGPGYTNWDANASRSFPVFRGSTMVFRAEYFDVLNHTELKNPANTNPVANPTSFGTITSTVTDFYSNQLSRTAQFSLKYQF